MKFRIAAAVMVLAACAAVDATNRGQPVTEPGLRGRTDILYFLDFDDENAARKWFRKGKGYGWTGDKKNIRFGRGALEIQHTTGTHYPMEIHPKLDEVDVAFVRWYRKWDDGYDFTQHKMPGVYARAMGLRGGTAGIGERPDREVIGPRWQVGEPEGD